ncbi:MAG: right-handed parallel beta-helix repeat-containing protein [Verrucomicrobiota bacterium]|nr:right-handed parallel beta-helix repeat-containing protein [Verrucomicrobiota bacterium]
MKPLLIQREICIAARLRVPRHGWIALFTLTAMLFSSEVAATGNSYFVSPNGSDTATGTQANPYRTIEHALSNVRKSDTATGGVVWLMDGAHRQASSLVIDASLSGTAEAPFTIRALHAGKAILSAGVEIPSHLFEPIRDVSRKSLVQAKARSQVRAARLAGTPVGKALENGYAPLIVSGSYPLIEARWPNKGYAHIQNIIDKGAIWAAGRTPGPRPKSSVGNPIGGSLTLHETWEGNWEEELATGIGKPSVQGYFHFDWHFERSRLARETNGVIRLASDTRYGIGGIEKIPRRLFVRGLLCELDRPGEWFWDASSQTLYLWPVAQNASVAVARDIPLLEIRNADFIQIEGLILEQSGSGMVIKGGSHSMVAGCEFRNIRRTGIMIEGGRHHRIQSCNIHNMEVPLVVEGTDPEDYQWDLQSDPPRLVADGHVFSNNHIRDCTHARGIRLNGVGIVFSHNLVHDLPGSAISWRGNNMIFEYNEFHSVLKEMGDWGVTYTGAKWHSFGNILRYNFVHNVFGLPQAHPVNGFYYDDLEMGDTTFGNVFYKVGNRSVMLNGGAAQTVANNLFIDNYVNVYQTGLYAEKRRAMRAKFDSGELKRGDKSDYWWKTEQITGKEGWASPPWSSAYPAFKRAVELDPYNPVLTTISNNYEMGTIEQAVWLRAVPEGMVEPEPMMPITAEAFVDPEALDFAFKPGFQPLEGFERIPFEDIGLVKDEFRKRVPDKDTYRREVRQKNEGRVPYDPDAIYDWKTMNDILYEDPPYWMSK